MLKYQLFDTVDTMREWLSGGAPPCQGGGRGFDPRLALFLCPEIKQLCWFLDFCVLWSLSPFESVSYSSGYISSCLSSFLPTYHNFFNFQWVFFLLPLLILTHLLQLFRLPVGLFPPASPHSYPPISYFSSSSGYFSNFFQKLQI